MNPPFLSLIQKFGPPGYENDKGKLSRLNEIFWAACYAKTRERIIFEPDEREFYDYEPASGIFIPKSSDLIRTELNAMMLRAAREWSGWAALEQFRSARQLNGVIDHLRGHIEERDFFNHPPPLVHLGNCTLRFEPDGSKFNVEPFSPEHRSRNRSPINYDPKATCPEFERTLLGHINED